jgi:tagaturonate reductase
MPRLNRRTHAVAGPNFPEKVVQFGEGNFLRAFVDWMIDQANRQGLFGGSVVVVQPLAVGLIDILNEQDGLFTVLLRGARSGQPVDSAEVVSCVRRGLNPYTQWSEFLACAANPDLRFLVSNTTEAGITFVEEPFPTDVCPASFPAKVTALLYTRFQKFAGRPDKGLILIPCELIERNGGRLHEVCLQLAAHWQLGDEFIAWLDAANIFLNTLVDRIVPGYPRDEIEALTVRLGYEDRLLVTGELAHRWVIEGDPRLAAEWPLAQAGLNVIWTDDLRPYRTQKVRVLNGLHTIMAAIAFPAGHDTVHQAIADPLVGGLLRRAAFEEIIPTISGDETERRRYAEAILERFANPFFRHYLMSIALNSVSKFKVRVLPTLLDFTASHKCVPRILSFSLAGLITLYRGTRIEDGQLQCRRGDQPYAIQDDPPVLAFFCRQWQEFQARAAAAASTAEAAQALARQVLAESRFWGQDLNLVPGLTASVAADLTAIIECGPSAALATLAG